MENEWVKIILIDGHQVVCFKYSNADNSKHFISVTCNYFGQLCTEVEDFDGPLIDYRNEKFASDATLIAIGKNLLDQHRYTVDFKRDRTNSDEYQEMWERMIKGK